MKIDWKKKLSSRKFWMAIAGFIAGLYVFFTSPVTSEKITGLVMSFGSVCSYIFGEGWIDSENVKYLQTYSEGESDADSE